MTWVCIPCIFSPVEVEDSFLTSSQDTKLWGQLNEKNMPKEFFSQDSLTEACLSSLFGPMSAHSDTITQPVQVTSTDSEASGITLSSAGVSPAKIFPAPEKGRVLTGTGQAFGTKCSVSFGRFDPDTFSLKTAQCSWLEDLMSSSVDLPIAGTMFNGQLFQQVPLEQDISVTGFGVSPNGETLQKRQMWQTPTAIQVPLRDSESWDKKAKKRESTNRYTLPPGTLQEQVMISGDEPCWDWHESPINQKEMIGTPTASMSVRSAKFAKGRVPSPAEYVAMYPERETFATPTTMDALPPKSEQALLREMTVARPGRSKPANLRDQVSNMDNWKIFPTPRAKEPGRTTEGYGRGLAELVEGKEQRKLFPTPKATDGDKGTRTLDGAIKEFERGKNIDLGMIVKMCPTPQARDFRSGKAKRFDEKQQKNLNDAVADSESEKTDARLNPEWVCWLMMWPKGWVNLEPLPENAFDWCYPCDEPFDVPRVTSGCDNRAAKLKAIGNGQLSLCAATAFNLLMERFDK